MIRRIIALAVASVAMVSAPRDVHASRVVPLSFFRIPITVTGEPHHYYGEGGACDPQPCETEYHFQARANIQPQSYQYEFRPNVPSTGSVEGYYDVAIYPTTEAARKANLAARGNPNIEGNAPAPRVPIAQPVVDNEWLRGHVVPNAGRYQCDAIGGARYQNVVVTALIINYDAVRDVSTFACSAEYHWTTRVIKAAYGRAVAYVKQR